MAVRRLQREARELVRHPLDGIVAGPVGDDLFHWEATLDGPAGTPYEGGQFRLKMYVPQDYPYRPPRVVFATKVYHTNINEKGNICLDVLMADAWDGDGWSPALNLGKVLLSVSVLLSQPNPDHPLCPDIGRLYRTNRSQHDQTAREWTLAHAVTPGATREGERNAERGADEVKEVEEKTNQEIAAGTNSPAQAAATARQQHEGEPHREREPQQQQGGQQQQQQQQGAMVPKETPADVQVVTTATQVASPSSKLMASPKVAHQVTAPSQGLHLGSAPPLSHTPSHTPQPASHQAPISPVTQGTPATQAPSETPQLTKPAARVTLV